jgi:hypothetical protein
VAAKRARAAVTKRRKRTKKKIRRKIKRTLAS